MALLVILAVGGAFGDGPLSRATIRGADGSTVALSRVMRAESPERVLLTAPATSGTVALALDSATLRWLTLESTVPRAVAERRGAAQMEIDVAPARGGTVAVEMVITPHTIGRHSLRTKLGTAPWSDVRIVVLP